MAEFTEYAEKLEIKKMVISMMLTALAFVVAFQWRDVIKETIELALPPGEGMAYKWMATIGFTLIAAGVAIVLVKVQKMNLVPDHLEPQKRVAMELKKRKALKKK